jgi:nucleotide-binding universal stress UspA family protein
MIKILVPTDYSANSRAGMRFAAQIAAQNKNVKLTFFHHTDMIKNKKYEDIYQAMMDEKLHKLRLLATSVVQNIGLKKSQIEFVVVSGKGTAESMLTYADVGKFDYISISTRGEGLVKKLLGSNTAELLKIATIPVIAVPANYRRKKITKILYVSDLTFPEDELNIVKPLVKMTSAELTVWHASTLAKPIDVKVAQNMLKPHTKGIKSGVVIEEKDLLTPLEDKVNYRIEKDKPQLVVMFSRARKGFWENLLLPSKSTAIAADPKVPMIAMKFR